MYFEKPKRPFLASNKKTSNIKNSTPLTRFAELLIIKNQTSLFRTSNGLKHVCLLEIKLKHSIFGFEQTDIEHHLIHH